MSVPWELEKKILFCLDYEIREWERRFLLSIMYNIVSVSERRRLSDKQGLVLDRIYKQACKESEELIPILVYEYMGDSVLSVAISSIKAKPNILSPRPELKSFIVDPPERSGRIYFHNEEEYEKYKSDHPRLPALDEIPFDFPFFIYQTQRLTKFTRPRDL